MAMLKLVLIVPLTFLSLLQQDKMVKTKINDNITVSLPSTFYPMSPDDLAQRYPSVRQPVGAYTDGSRVIDFSVNISATQWRERDVEIARDFFKASIYNLYDKVDMIKEGLEDINDKTFITFEFVSRINGDQYSLDKKDPVRKYTYIQYLVINGKTLVFSFNSPIHLKEQWQGIAAEIMESIKVKNSI